MRTAAYARFSTDTQRDASIEDQLRNIRAHCARMGWPDPVVFADKAISGARTDRPEYQKLMHQARRFDVILVDDLSRFSRDSVETQQQIRRLKFAGVRVVGVCDGIDTANKGHKVGVGLRGLMSEVYLDDLADKTHRGLTGRALAGASAGGLPYGYRVTTTGQRAIDEAQAAIVRRIFAEYLAGQSARQIAGQLNAERVPSARGSSWAMTAIHGDIRRGIGILANPIYKGTQVWNRSQWVKHPDTGRRIRKERPASEWVTTEHPELAIIDAATFDTVQARLKRQSRAVRGSGSVNRYLLSGILRCADCGGPLVIINRYQYGCAAAKDRGTCSSSVRVARLVAERALLSRLKDQMLTDAAFQRFQRAVLARIKQAASPDAPARELAEAEKVRENIMAALRAGIITPSTKAELEQAEARVEVAKVALASVRHLEPATFLPRAREVWRDIVSKLENRASNLPAAREAVISVLGDNVIVRNEQGAIYAEITPCKITLVAGARYVPYLTHGARFLLQEARIIPAPA